MKFNRQLAHKGQRQKASARAAAVDPGVRQLLPEGDQPQGYFTGRLRLPDVGPKVRIVLLWAQREAPPPRILLVTNRVPWEVTRIVRGYRCRWTGTEPFARDGQQPLGLGDGQLRDREGPTRHRDLVRLAYSLLVSQRRQGHA